MTPEELNIDQIEQNWKDVTGVELRGAKFSVDILIAEVRRGRAKVARLQAALDDSNLKLMAANNKIIAAETLCAAIDRTIHNRALDARSAIADARLNFSDRMYSPEEAQEIIEKRLYPYKA